MFLPVRDGGYIYPLCSRFYGELGETPLLEYFLDVIVTHVLIISIAIICNRIGNNIENFYQNEATWTSCNI